MRTKRLSSTELKRNTAEVLNTVAYGGSEIIVERYGEPLVRILPIEDKPKMSEDAAEKAIERTFGILPDFPDVTKMRNFRERDIEL